MFDITNFMYQSHQIFDLFKKKEEKKLTHHKITKMLYQNTTQYKRLNTVFQYGKVYDRGKKVIE